MLTYYDLAPFVLDKKKQLGLVYDFGSYLNSFEHPDYVFEVLYLPRKRLNMKLQQGTSAAVMFVSPKWFKDGDYVWSSPILNGQNDIISLKENPIEYSGVT